MTDRELDALVAVHVMGWVEVDGLDYMWETPQGRRRKTTTIRLHPKFQGPGAERPQGFLGWSPSTDIAAAWEVALHATEPEEDGSQRLWFALESPTPDDMHERCWRFSIMRWYEDQGDERTATADADTAPRAICLAALRAVGVEVEL